MLLAVVSLVALVVAKPGLAQEPSKGKVLFFYRSAGYEHGPVVVQADGTTIAGNALIKYGEKKNFEVVCTHDGSVFDGDISQYDAFVFYISGNIFGAANNNSVAGSKPMTEAGFQKLLDAVKGGKGFVGIHSASDAECGKKNAEGVDIYTAFVGGRFESHGAMQEAAAAIVKPTEMPWLKEKGDKDVAFEEWYTMREYNKDMHVLLIQETEGMKGDCYKRPPFPSSWIRAEGKGRVGYVAYGHDNPFWKEDANVRKIGEFIDWALGRFDMDTTPNFETVTPKGNQLKH